MRACLPGSAWVLVNFLSFYYLTSPSFSWSWARTFPNHFPSPSVILGWMRWIETLPRRFFSDRSVGTRHFGVDTYPQQPGHFWWGSREATKSKNFPLLFPQYWDSWFASYLPWYVTVMAGTCRTQWLSHGTTWLRYLPVLLQKSQHTPLSPTIANMLHPHPIPPCCIWPVDTRQRTQPRPKWHQTSLWDMLWFS